MNSPKQSNTSDSDQDTHISLSVIELIIKHKLVLPDGVLDEKTLNLLNEHKSKSGKTFLSPVKRMIKRLSKSE